MQSDKKNIVLMRVDNLINTYKSGGLGGEIMPEDENPGLPKSSANELLDGTMLQSIDIHTPLWLWSRGKFQVDI